MVINIDPIHVNKPNIEFIKPFQKLKIIKTNENIKII